MNWSYLTGYFEADGTAYGTERKGHGASVYVSWMSTDKCVIDKIAAFLGVNTTSYKYGKNPKHKATWKTRYNAAVHDHNRLRDEILPKLIEHSQNDRKKAQLEAVLKFIEGRDWVEDRRTRKLKVIEELYVGQGFTATEIAKMSDEFNTAAAVDYYIHRYGYPKGKNRWSKKVPSLTERRPRYGTKENDCIVQGGK